MPKIANQAVQQFKQLTISGTFNLKAGNVRNTEHANDEITH